MKWKNSVNCKETVATQWFYLTSSANYLISFLIFFPWNASNLSNFQHALTEINRERRPLAHFRIVVSGIDHVTSRHGGISRVRRKGFDIYFVSVLKVKTRRILNIYATHYVHF